MKKNIRNIILATLLMFSSLMTFSCKGATDSLLPGGKNGTPDEVQYNGKKPREAMAYVGNVVKTYNPVNQNLRYATDELKDYKGTGVTAKVDIKLVEYDSISLDIRNYISKFNSTSARHKTYTDLNCKNDMDYVEFTSYIDMRNGNVIDYDLTFFNKSSGELSSMGKRLSLSPDMEIDIFWGRYIKTGEKAPKYRYPYAIR